MYVTSAARATSAPADLTILSASPALASDTTACSAALHGVTFERNDMNGPTATAVRLVLFESKAATSRDVVSATVLQVLLCTVRFLTLREACAFEQEGLDDS